MTTKERLAVELEKAGAPQLMIENARAGAYDDFESQSATPIVDLVSHCRSYGLYEFATRAINGEFDGTKEEGDEWFAKEGHKLIPGSKG